MKEYGGYLELDTFKDNEYRKNMKRINTGRNALIYLVEAKKIKKIYIPIYLCDSVSNCLLRENVDFEYYHVDDKFRAIFNKKLGVDEYLYINNLYGQLNKEFIKTLKLEYDRIIVDNTHAFFEDPIEDVDTIYSCRKFFGLPDGAYLYTNAKLIRGLEYDSSKNRMTHILGRLEENASKYYKNFCESDEQFDKLPLKKMSKITHNLLRAIDYDNVINRRLENWNLYNEQFKNINKLSLQLNSAPYMYPLYIENGENLRKKLIQHKIYIPILWNNVTKVNGANDMEIDMAHNIIPLPCDQRYDREDMLELIDIIGGLINE